MGILAHKDSFERVELAVVTTVGRSRDRALVLKDPAASAEHAVVRWLGDAFYVRDKGSSNGTYVQRERLENGKDRRLVRGNEIRFGANNETWILEDDTSPPGIPAGITDVVKWPLQQITLLIGAPNTVALVAGGKRHCLSLSPTGYDVVAALGQKLVKDRQRQLKDPGWVSRKVLAAQLEVSPTDLPSYFRRFVEKVDGLGLLLETASDSFARNEGQIRLAFGDVRFAPDLG